MADASPTPECPQRMLFWTDHGSPGGHTEYEHCVKDELPAKEKYEIEVDTKAIVNFENKYKRPVLFVIVIQGK